MDSESFNQHFPNSGMHEIYQQFLRLFVANQSRIFTFILMLVPNNHDAEDIFQKTVSLMWTKFGEFKPSSSFSAWGIQCARYIILNYRRSKKRAKVQFNSEVMEIVSEYALAHDKNDYSNNERLKAIKSCISRLDKRRSERRLGVADTLADNLELILTQKNAREI